MNHGHCFGANKQDLSLESPTHDLGIWSLQGKASEGSQDRQSPCIPVPPLKGSADFCCAPKEEISGQTQLLNCASCPTGLKGPLERIRKPQTSLSFQSNSLVIEAGNK